MGMNSVKEEVLEGKYILSYPCLSSTQDYAREIISSGEVNIIGVRTDFQSAGRGRLQSRWESTSNSSLLVSYILDMANYTERQVKLISLVAAASVISTISNASAITPLYKWPNDILISDRKVCGVLIEIPPINTSPKKAIVGIGINLTQRTFPVEIEPIATSIALEGGTPPSPQSLSKSLYLQLLSWNEVPPGRGIKPIIDFLLAHDGFTGKPYRAITEGGERVGTAEGISSEGELILRMDDGSLIVTQNATSLQSVHF